jgi:hypothetical protein
MAHQEREKNVIVELTLRVRIRRCRTKLSALKKWIIPLLASVLAKVVIHFLHG